MVQLQDFNDPPPSRKPWIVILAVLVLAGFAWLLLYQRKPDSIPDPVPVKPPVVASVEKPAQPVPVASSADVSNRVSSSVATNAPASTVAVAGIPPSALEEAAVMEKAGRLVEARERYLQILTQYPGAAGIADVEDKAAAIGIELIMKKHPMPEKVEYVVAAGDSLDKIARKFASTKELMITNNLILNPALIKRGDRYRVFNGTFKVSVNKSRNDLLVTLNGRFFKRYKIGTGKYGATPAGSFVIADRIPEPVWWKPDGKAVPFGQPENILGTHWLKLKPVGDTPAVSGYGIHGTWDDASIGKAESAGCVRMHNTDVEQLFVMLPMGTEVVIEE